MGILFFNAQWVFLATFGLGLLYRIMRDYITCGRPEAPSDGEEERLLGSV